MIFSPAIFPRSGFSAFARYTNSAFENYTTIVRKVVGNISEYEKIENKRQSEEDGRGFWYG